MFFTDEGCVVDGVLEDRFDVLNEADQLALKNKLYLDERRTVRSLITPTWCSGCGCWELIAISAYKSLVL